MRAKAFARAGLLAAILGFGGRASAATADFLGIWSNTDADNSGIARLVIAPVQGGGANIQLFGRCPKQECDWGSQAARLYADDPGSPDIRIIAADFAGGGARRRVVLHLAVGGALRFDVQTDFTGGGNNFATSGNVVRTGDWRAAAQVAMAAPPPANAPPAASGMPAAAPPVPPSGGWFGDIGKGSSVVGVGAALPPGYVPSKWEECIPFDLDQARVANVDGAWRVVDFAHRLLNFGSSQDAARGALAALAFYHFDEQCFVTKDSVQMLYWKRAGRVPANDMPGNDCDVLDPTTVKAIENDGAWKVVAGGRALFDFDEDKDAAARAVSVIRTYKLNRQCFFVRGHQKAQYWLSR
jgi:hypothetical protein